MKYRMVLMMVVLLLGVTLLGSGATANSPPTIEVTGIGTCAPTGADGAILLCVVDDTSSKWGMTFTATSSNPVFVPNGNITFDTNVGNRCHVGVEVKALPFAPGPNFTIITITATDESNNSTSIDMFVAAGNPGVNTVIGTPGPDMLFGLAGWDTIIGGGGNDLLCGGPGPDTLMGGSGNDSLHGDAGNDVLNCGPGVDDGFGGPGIDVNQFGLCERWSP